jgi:dihydroorotase
MSPPLAAEPHRQALIEGLRDGTVDCIATDHAPHHPAEKEVPFPAAPNGVIGLETAFPALVAGLVEPGIVTLELIVERMTAGPARAFGLQRPRIAVGAEADLALWDLRERYTVSEADLHSRSRNCAFLGRGVQGRCLLTLAGGRTAHRATAGVAA